MDDLHGKAAYQCEEGDSTVGQVSDMQASGDSVKSAVRYTTRWRAVIGGNVGP